MISMDESVDRIRKMDCLGYNSDSDSNSNSYSNSNSNNQNNKKEIAINNEKNEMTKDISKLSSSSINGTNTNTDSLDNYEVTVADTVIDTVTDIDIDSNSPLALLQVLTKKFAESDSDDDSNNNNKKLPNCCRSSSEKGYQSAAQLLSKSIDAPSFKRSYGNEVKVLAPIKNVEDYESADNLRKNFPFSISNSNSNSHSNSHGHGHSRGNSNKSDQTKSVSVVEPVFESSNRPIVNSTGAISSRGFGNDKQNKDLDKESAKERVKRQRLSGQSGVGPDFKTWRSDEEMRMRQQFD